MGSRPPVSDDRLSGPQAGVFRPEQAVVGFECAVAMLQVQDLGDPGDVDALGDEIVDLLQAIQVVVAILSLNSRKLSRAAISGTPACISRMLATVV